MVLDATALEKVLVNNLTAEDVQTGFTNKHAVDHHIERARNIKDKEEIMMIAPIPQYLICDGFEKYLDAAMLYERLMDSTETSVTIKM